MEAIITWSVQKAALIPLTHVYQPTFESDGAWGVWSQHHPNVIYVVKFSFTKIFCCTCELALQGYMCIHQIVVILTCTYIFQEDIIHYCGTWYGSQVKKSSDKMCISNLTKLLHLCLCEWCVFKCVFERINQQVD
jgi:hypothetical protein